MLKSQNGANLENVKNHCIIHNAIMNIKETV